MNPKLQINPPYSDEDLYDDLFETGYPQALIQQPSQLPQMESNIRNWKVARFQRFLKGKGIPFHNSDNKTTLFHLT